MGPFVVGSIETNNRIHLKSSQGFPPKQFLELAFSIFQ